MEVVKDETMQGLDLDNSFVTGVRGEAPSDSKMRKLINELTARFDQTDVDDADCQQLQTEFLEFTEYMPSDMDRSQQLIEHFQLKADAAEADFDRLALSLDVHTHDELHADPHISPRAEKVEQYLSARRKWLHCIHVCEAEKDRVVRNNKAWMERLAIINDKLRDIREGLVLNLPTSQEEPNPQVAPMLLHNISPSKPGNKKHNDAVKQEPPSAVHGLSADDTKPAEAKRNNFWHDVRRRKVIVVPGDIMPPGFLDLDQHTDFEDCSDEEDGQGPSLKPRFKFVLKPSNPQKFKIPKQNRVPRDPDQPGTNVHSSVAGISTTNALAKLQAPPADAKPGSIHAPWLQLTEYELAILRKRMKKNAVWGPSATMLNRELTERGRGIVAYRAAKARAEAAGEPFDALVTNVKRNDKDAAMVAEQLREEYESLEEPVTINKGMKLNDLKKAKREAQQKEAAMAAEEMSGGLKTMLSRELSNSFMSRPKDKQTPKTKDEQAKAKDATPIRTIGTIKLKSRDDKSLPAKEDVLTNGKASQLTITSSSTTGKRKRDSTAEITEVEGSNTPAPELKRSKVETPVPAPRAAGLRSSRLEIAVPMASSASVGSDSAGTSVNTVTTTTTVPLRSSSPRNSSTPILPPIKDKNIKKDPIPAPISIAATTVPAPSTGRSTRAQSARISGTPTPAATPPPVAGAVSSSRRPSSRGKTSSIEPVSVTGRERASRRSSTVHNTPVPEAPPPRPASRRGNKRQPPGAVADNTDGTAAVRTQRASAPRKKAGPKKQQKAEEEKGMIEVWDEIDDQGHIIDPDEPRFCMCNRVSFGTMIGCENDQCDKEWFHLECVGLEAAPSRTTKWYCPDCRVTLNIGEKGEVTARGKRK